MQNVPARRSLLTLLLCTALAACNYPGIPAAVTQPAEPTSTSTPQATALPAVLPSPLYFLSQRSGSAQIWRLEPDGVNLSQLSHEPEPVVAFDVSANGELALLSNNQIYLADAHGGDRRLFLDNAAADRQADDFVASQAVSAPLFAPDGQRLAYGYGGVWVYDQSSLSAEKLLQNEDGQVYTPLSWSPDGSQLLVSIASTAGNSLAAWNFAQAELVRFETDGLACCQASWAADSRSVLLASATLGLTEAGLWRYDSQTGEQATLIETVSGETYYLAAWPLQLPNGDLQYFYASAAELPEGDLPLYLVRSAGDGVSGRSQLRDDAFSLREVLWAPDGSLAVVAQAAAGGGGPLVLAYADGGPLQVLVDSGYGLRWGR